MEYPKDLDDQLDRFALGQLASDERLRFEAMMAADSDLSAEARFRSNMAQALLDIRLKDALRDEEVRIAARRRAWRIALGALLLCAIAIALLVWSTRTPAPETPASDVKEVQTRREPQEKEKEIEVTVVGTVDNQIFIGFLRDAYEAYQNNDMASAEAHLRRFRSACNEAIADNASMREKLKPIMDDADWIDAGLSLSRQDFGRFLQMVETMRRNGNPHLPEAEEILKQL